MENSFKIRYNVNTCVVIAYTGSFREYFTTLKGGGLKAIYTQCINSRHVVLLPKLLWQLRLLYIAYM